MKIIKYVGILLAEKLWNRKNMTILVLQVFLIYMYIKPLIQYSVDVNYSVVPVVFPFIISDLRFLFLFMLGMIYHFSDIPFMQYSEMYQMIRMGRIPWCIGQILTLIGRSFAMIGVNIVFSILFFIGHMEITLGWGKVLHTVAISNAGGVYQLPFKINYEALIQFEPLQLMFLTWLVCGLVLSFVALIMFVLSIYIDRIVAISAAVIMNLLTFFMANIHPLLRMVTSKWIPVSWMRIAIIDTKDKNSFQLPTLSYMMTILVLGSGLMIIMALIRIRKIEFHWVKEEG